MRTFIYIAALSVCCIFYGKATEADSSAGASSSISFYADRDSVYVYENEIYIGTTPCDSLSIQPGTHVFTYVHGDQKNWLHSELVETLQIAPSEHVIRKITFPAVYRIISEPYGAEIYMGDSVIGRTPFILSATAEKNIVVLTKNGYGATTIPLSKDQPFVNVKLPPLADSLVNNKERYLTIEPSDNNLDIYLVTGAAVLSGVVSAYCKIKADSYYNDYQQTNNPLALQKVHSYDTAAGISLAASEIGLFFLSYLLLSR